MRWFRRRPSWQELHPLPTGWRPRTRIDVAGREVEPWGYLVTDATGYPLDGGELWLPLHRDHDQAAWELLDWWLRVCAPEMGLSRREIGGLRLAARPAAYPGDRVGVAYAHEQALTG